MQITNWTMAKRKKSVKRVTRRRRYSGVSGIGTVRVNEVLGTIGGVVLSRLIVNTLSKKMTALQSPVTKAITQIGLGVVTKPVFSALKMKSPMLDSLASGMIIGGGVELVKTVAPASLGVADETPGDVIVINGTPEISEINGMDEIGGMDDIGGMDISEINGMDEEENNF